MHLETLQGSFLSGTNVYLGYTCHFGGHLGFRNIIFMLHWSKFRNSINPRLPPDAILDYKKAYTEYDRESSVLDSRHLEATFLKKSAF